MRKILISVAIVILLGCVALIVFKEYNGGPCDYEYQIVDRSYSPTNDTVNVTTVYMSYPVFSHPLYNGAAVDSVNASVVKHMLPDGKMGDVFAEGFIKDYKDFLVERKEYMDEEEIKAYTPTWYYSSQMYVLVNGSKLIVTQCDDENYTGGAHGMYGSFFSNYDMKKGKELTLDDVFTDTVALAENITKYFIKAYELKDSVSLSEQGFFVEGPNLPITSNFALLPEGVVFVYNVYEIASYAFGMAEITVPYQAISGIMKYTPDFKKADVFKQEIEITDSLTQTQE
ncbi:MAG: DUF3298 domain-containing protein [Flavobacteriales bacterium]|nr:DUF3298 domain-containing protein [Flavobacteriales bacterium]